MLSPRATAEHVDNMQLPKQDTSRGGSDIYIARYLDGTQNRTNVVVRRWCSIGCQAPKLPLNSRNTTPRSPKPKALYSPTPQRPNPNETLNCESKSLEHPRLLWPARRTPRRASTRGRKAWELRGLGLLGFRASSLGFTGFRAPSYFCLSVGCPMIQLQLWWQRRVALMACFPRDAWWQHP